MLAFERREMQLPSPLSRASMRNRSLHGCHSGCAVSTRSSSWMCKTTFCPVVLLRRPQAIRSSRRRIGLLQHSLRPDNRSSQLAMPTADLTVPSLNLFKSARPLR